MPPAATTTKRPLAAPSENVPVATAASANLYATRPVASLTRLSPSMMVTTRRGTLSRWVTAVAATASGGDTIAPSTNATSQLIPGITACAAQATAVVVATTRPMASCEIGRLLAAKSRHDVNHAAA